jgi:hypothetical protein
LLPHTRVGEMLSELYQEVDEGPCEVCGRDVRIEYKRECSPEGLWGKWMPHRAFCIAGCAVHDAEERIRDHIA